MEFEFLQGYTTKQCCKIRIRYTPEFSYRSFNSIFFSHRKSDWLDVINIQNCRRHSENSHSNFLVFCHRNGFEHFDYPNFRRNSRFQSHRASNVNCMCFQCFCPTSRLNDKLFHHTVLILHMQPVLELSRRCSIHNTYHHYHTLYAVGLCWSLFIFMSMCVHVYEHVWTYVNL